MLYLTLSVVIYIHLLRVKSIRGRYSAISHARSRITCEQLLFIIRGDSLSLSRSPLWQSVNAKSRTKRLLSLRVCDIRAREIAPLGRALMVCRLCLRNRRLSLRRERRITGRHWLPLFAPWVSQCRVQDRNNSFTAVLLSNM